MDYAIYKTNDSKNARAIHRFTQEATGHKAKKAAQEKLNEMWLRIVCKPNLYRNANGSKDEFLYDHITSTTTSERIRFYIGKL
ncbi:MAG: hypothetical protein [Bacteriophage sp.]|nr:MAG: hypothetical protein [Bacteriophage sp.]